MQATWHHTAMAVQDMERAKNFYCDLLGFEIDWERPAYAGEPFEKVVGMPNASAHVVMLKGYGSRLELFRYHNPQGCVSEPKRQCDFGLTHFAFTVKNIHEIYERLSAAGVEFNCPPQNLRPGVWGTYMKDPEGTTIELVQYDEP
ncbi:MAG: VOC family protein [Desulfobacterales bacterium]|jgi:glyoxylase I family protein